MKREAWLAAALESAATARAIVRDAAGEQGLDDRSIWDLMLATTEAVSNAVLHGQGCAETGTITCGFKPPRTASSSRCATAAASLAAGWLPNEARAAAASRSCPRSPMTSSCCRGPRALGCVSASASWLPRHRLDAWRSGRGELEPDRGAPVAVHAPAVGHALHEHEPPTAGLVHRKRPFAGSEARA